MSFAPLTRSLSAGSVREPRGQGTSLPGQFLKLDSLKCNFQRFQDRNWLSGNVFQGAKRCSQKMKYLTDLAIIMISLQFLVFS